MRHIKLATIVVLSILTLANSHAAESAKEVRRGEFTISFNERSPLSSRRIFARRFGWDGRMNKHLIIYSKCAIIGYYE